MRKLNTPFMRKLLRKAVKEARKYRVPNEGLMLCLSDCYGDMGRKGWHYQADYINDSRDGGLRVTVWAFKPKKSGGSTADYYLSKSMEASA